MSTDYFSKALIQEMLQLSNIKEIQKLKQQIRELKKTIFIRQKKHRRCDKDISKQFKCQNCYKFYASDVALKLHLKLKHVGENQHQDKSTSQSPCELQHSLETI